MDGNNMDLPPHQQLAIMSRWYMVSRCLHVVAEIGVADHIEPQGSSIETLAVATNTKPDYLLRLMRYLASYKIFQETRENYFCITPLAEPLREDAAISLRAILRMVDNAWWQAAGQLQHTLETGESGFVAANGSPFFTFLAEQDERQQRFDHGMAAISQFDDAVIAKAYDFSPVKTVIDVGGGQGGLLAEILKINPHLQGILFDQARVVAHPNRLIERDVMNRCQCIAGNFFEKLPREIDLYIYKGVLHDFNNALVIELLSNCKEYMGTTSKILIVEQMIPNTDAPHPNKTMDMVMMMLLDGQQRTVDGWHAIAEQVGFKVTKTVATESLFTCIELVLN